MRTDEKAFVERLKTLTDDPDALRATLEGVRPEDVAEAFPRLERDEMLRVLQLLDPETAAYVLRRWQLGFTRVPVIASDARTGVALQHAVAAAALRQTEPLGPPTN